MNARPRHIVFRLELGGLTGWGHLARCAALAGEMRSRGWICVAWTNGDLAVAPEDLREPFGEVRAVSAGPGAADWIVVDHYDVSDADLWQLRATAAGARLLAIDDEALRTLEAADVVVNSRLGLESAPYASARALLGERYALLRAGLRRPVAIVPPFRAEVAPVLIVLGGTDPLGLAAETVHALADIDDHRLAPVVVRSRALAGGDALAQALARFSQHVWLERLTAAEFAGWARCCCYAVSACGGTLFELAFLGLPFVGIVVADNQRAFAGEVGRRWALPIIDAAAGDVRTAVGQAMRQLLVAQESPGPSPRVPIGGIDGLGAARVADALERR